MAKNTLRFIDDLLGPIFAPPKPKRKADPYYGKFKRLCLATSLSYSKDRDSYIDIEPTDVFPNGLHFPHYTWDESFERLQAAIDGDWIPDDKGYLTQ
tara:strand:- start:5725 stop:6015 length:291 start_codon:yes stop_codon:yes gene_type:complete